MSTKRQNRRAALLYAGSVLGHDDGVIAGDLADGALSRIANELLRQAGWTSDKWPTDDDIYAALGVAERGRDLVFSSMRIVLPIKEKIDE